MMKKLMTVLLAFMLIAPFAAQADKTSKQLDKAREKQCKEKMKQLKKENWTIFGSTNTLEVALLSHYEKLATIENAHEVVGVANGFKSKNIGQQSTYNNACMIYAQEAGSDLSGRIASDIFGSTSNPDAEFDNFYQAYERGVQKEIRGEMKQSFSIIRTLPDGTNEMQTFFIIDEQGAASARIKALEAAMAESEAAQKYAEKISSYVRGK